MDCLKFQHEVYLFLRKTKLCHSMNNFVLKIANLYNINHKKNYAVLKYGDKITRFFLVAKSKDLVSYAPLLDLKSTGNI